MISLDAPLCPASPRADLVLRERLRAITDLCRELLADDLVAVVLAGSLARGQGMVLNGADGPRVLSDIDLYVVRRRTRRSVEATLRARIRDDLAAEGVVLAPLDLAFVGVDHFAGLGDSLPARQLALATRLLHVDETARWASPQAVGPPEDDVDPDDAHRLLLNRMAETHLLVEADWFTCVHRAKRWIDAPLAWLAAHGEYEPSRRRQLDRLAALGADWSGPSRTWLDGGIETARAWLDTIESRELEPEELRAWPGGGADEAVMRWTWPFARACFRTVGRTGVDPVRVLGEEAARDTTEVDADLLLVEDWLQRSPVVARLRAARRWHALAPVAVRPWWRYALGGSGHERVYGACALRYAGRPAWTRPLDTLLNDSTPLHDGDAEALGRLWADWILGGGRR